MTAVRTIIASTQKALRDMHSTYEKCLMVAEARLQGLIANFRRLLWHRTIRGHILYNPNLNRFIQVGQWKRNTALCRIAEYYGDAKHIDRHLLVPLSENLIRECLPVGALDTFPHVQWAPSVSSWHVKEDNEKA